MSSVVGVLLFLFLMVIVNDNCFTTPIVEDGLFHFPETGWLWYEVV